MAPHRGQDEKTERPRVPPVAGAEASGRRGGAAEDDRAERLGKRVGAVLGPALLALLAAWFVWHLLANGQQPA